MKLPAILLLLPSLTLSAQLPVRHPEGTVHGFLLLYAAAGGKRLAQGDLLQTVRDGRIDGRMVFQFDDGSLLDEQVTFAQGRTFSLERYSLVQRGPAFDTDLHVTLERSGGRYHVEATPHKEGAETKVYEGTLDLPADVVNGFPLTVAKNLPPGASRTAHIVAFLPEPRVIKLEYLPAGEARVALGANGKNVARWILRPDLGTVMNLLAKVTRKTPPDNQVWIVTDDVPAFVRFEGPLFVGGPIWRIDLAAPTWPSPAVATSAAKR